MYSFESSKQIVERLQYCRLEYRQGGILLVITDSYVIKLGNCYQDPKNYRLNWRVIVLQKDVWRTSNIKGGEALQLELQFNPTGDLEQVAPQVAYLMPNVQVYPR